MRKSPITVEQWIETLPTPPRLTYSTKSVSCSYINVSIKQPKRFLPREISLQSDDASSHCSSVESVLELRKPDPEAVLLGLGFGPTKSSNLISKIPQRFLQPSQLIEEIDINSFLEKYGEKNDQYSGLNNTSPKHLRSK